MKKWTLTTLLVVMLTAGVSEAVVSIDVTAIKTIPRIPGSVTTAGRPAVDNQTIVFGQVGPNLVGVTYNAASQTLTTWGAASPLTAVTVNASGFFQNDPTGIGGKWAAVGGSPDALSLTVPFKIVDLSTSTRHDITAQAGTQGTDQHFFDVNTNGDVVWTRWESGGQYSLMYMNMANTSVQTSLTMNDNSSMMPRISTESGRRITYSPNRYDHRVYDLDTSTDYLVYHDPGAGVGSPDANALRSRISDDGNWIVFNRRPSNETQKRADLILVDVTDPTTPSVHNLSNDASVIREDPVIEILDADTGIVVWGESAVPEGIYSIKAAVLTGLSGTPVMGLPVTLAAGDSGNGVRFPSIDGNLVAWSYHWGDGATQTVQYMWIPEPAALTLLGLGSLALLRRR